jgi:hypothetical protein
MVATVDVGIIRVPRSHPHKLRGAPASRSREYASEWGRVKEKEHLLEK